MTKIELLERLIALEEFSKRDAEVAHSEADEALIEYIGDKEISNAFSSIIKMSRILKCDKCGRTNETEDIEFDHVIIPEGKVSRGYDLCEKCSLGFWDRKKIYETKMKTGLLGYILKGEIEDAN